jgi:hypothetical protein
MMHTASHESPTRQAPGRSPATPEVARLSASAAQASPDAAAGPDCCRPGTRPGWSPSALPADTELKRRVDRILPRSGLSVVIFFAAVIALLNVGLILPTRLDLLATGVASLAAGSWCSANFWRCRHAHCMITGAGWLTLAGFAFLEAGLGRSLIRGDEGLVFLAVLGAGLLFEGVWYLTHGTNAVSS